MKKMVFSLALILLTLFSFANGGSKFIDWNKVVKEYSKANFALFHYYIDPLNGNDANNGLTTATPIKTFAHLQSSITLGPGDIVSVKAATANTPNTYVHETYTPQQSGTSGVGNYITINSYGGGRAILTGSDVQSSGWASSATNVFVKTMSTQTNVVYVNNVRCNRVSSAGLITKEYDYFSDATHLYLYSPNNQDPTSTYGVNAIEAGVRDRVVVNNKDYILYDSLEIRDANLRGANAGAMRLGNTTSQSIQITNCLFQRSRNSGLEVTATTFNGLRIRNSTFYSNGDWGILFGGALSTDTASIVGCLFDYNGWGADLEGAQRANIQGSMRNVKIWNSEIAHACYGTSSTINTSHGVYANADSVAFYMYGCYIHDNVQGTGVKTRGSCWIDSCKFSGNLDEDFNPGGNGTFPIWCKFTRNTAYNSTAGFPMVNEQAKGTGRLGLTVLNNTSYKEGQGGQGSYLVADAIDSLVFENNIAYISNGRYGLQISSTAITYKLVDYNLYYNDDGTFQNRYNGSTQYTNLAAWQALGFDAHGLNANPLLIAPPTDMRLNTGSPAINAGVNVGLPFVGAAPDMGALESANSLPVAVITRSKNKFRLPATGGTLYGDQSYTIGGSTIVSYAWSFISGPTTAHFINANVVNPVVYDMRVPGTYTFQLIITDSNGATSTVQAPIRVVPIRTFRWF